MRRTIIAGNWKMNKDIHESKDLIVKILSGLQTINSNCEVVICPPFTSLSEAASMIKNTRVKLGAQNLHYEESGAFTGEISAKMLLSAGCEYVIIGHSERRTLFGEKDDLINRKIKRALMNGLKPIFCVGELLEEREKNITERVIETQVVNGLENLLPDQLNDLVVAYEPVWAIGTGKTATPEQAEEVHVFIRKLVGDRFSAKLAEDLPILYGGSVKPENSAELLNKENVDGALVGGACLEAESFLKIIKSA